MNDAIEMSEQRSMPHVVIVGGGISGLSAAFYLRKYARESHSDVQISLFEKQSTTGGKIVTDERSGYILDRGPDIFLSAKPAGLQLCRDLGIIDDVISTNPEHRRSFIRRGEELIPLPDGLSGLIPTRVSSILKTPLLSWSGKLRMLREPFIRRRSTDDDEELGTFIERRLGKELFDNLVGPLLGGIYGGDAKSLSVGATFPHFHRLEHEHGSLIRGLISERRKSSSSSAKEIGAFVSLANGMATLTDELERALGSIVSTGAMVERIDKAETGYEIRTREKGVDADSVIITTPASESSIMLEGLDSTISAELQEFEYGSTMVVTLAYQKSDVPAPLDGYGYLVPRREGHDVRACTWSSTKLPGRAPANRVLIRIFIGRHRDEPVFRMTDDEVVQVARHELLNTLSIAAEPEFTDVTRWMDSMPKYTVGHLARLDRLDSLTGMHPGLFLAGSSYRGVGIPDCIEDGRRVAQNVLQYLTQ